MEVQVYSAPAQDLSELPPLPGLYAFYPRFSPDKKKHTTEVEPFVNLLGRYDSALRPPPADVEVNTGYMGGWWKAAAVPPHRKELRAMSEGFGDAIGVKDVRQTAWEVLARFAVPFLVSPLYIGLTTEQTLPQRLHQHTGAITAYVDNDDPHKSSSDLDSKLAARCYARGLRVGDLEVWCLGFRLEEGEDESVRSGAIVVLERLLIRWANPLLGKE